MSRIGKKPITIPPAVKIEIVHGKVSVYGPKGSLSRVIDQEIKLEMVADQVFVQQNANSRTARQKWGLVRSLVGNMVLGVTEGFVKTLNIQGVGYKASVQNRFLSLSLGYSHEIKFFIPDGVEVKCLKPTVVEISSFDKELLGQVAAVIRSLRPPEPYKGKGVRYDGEFIVRKEGKK